MAKETTITFKVSESMADLISRTAFDLDKGKSELIRCCILLSLDTVKAMPSLINRVQLEDRVINNTDVT